MGRRILMTNKGIRPYVCSVCGAPESVPTRHETAEHDLETLAKRARDLITEKAPWWTADDLSVRLGGTDAALIAAASPDVVLGLLDRLAHMTEARNNARAEVDRLSAAVRRVRELHRESNGSLSALYPNPICECGKDYPCPTIRALDGGVES